MAFKALGDLLGDGLTLPVDEEHVYTVPPPSAETGLRVQALMRAVAIAHDGGEPDAAVLDDAAERDTYADVLGPAYGQMITDGVSWPVLKHSAMTAMVWITQDREAAERYWNSGGDPSQLAPSRTQRRAATSAGAKSTPSRGSTSTTSGKGPARKRRPKPASR
ncbi:DUF7426 family protein [Streptomyces sp. CH6]|uniref:DUF7426 family protein n=1 Tax=unclassified Streptomyces TaxID=2593676 RepID=UPI003CFDC25D